MSRASPDKQPVAEFGFRPAATEVRDETSRDEWGSWYAKVSTINPQLGDLYLLGELIHAASFVAHEAGLPEPERHRYCAHAITSAGWTTLPLHSHLGTH